jgi:hypothetical protein
MGFKDFRVQSRNVQWGIEIEGEDLRFEDINCGSLLRIADAMEIISKQYTALLAEVEKYRQWWNEGLTDKRIMIHQIAGLKEYIRRLQNDIKRKN